MTAPTIAVTVIGGYLGAGKTTLVNHLLRTSGDRIGVIVNDFGEINIDADLIESHDGETISLANGCICCSLVDGFAAALDTVVSAEVLPERVLIEASGVADPAAVAAWAHAPGLELDGVVVLADLELIDRQLDDEWIGDVVRRQLSAADLIIANKVDRARVDSVARLSAHVDAPVLAAANAAVAAELVFAATCRARSERALDPVSATDYFHSKTWSWELPVDDRELDELLSSFDVEGVERVKGVVRRASAPDVRVVVQQVGARRQLTQTTGWPGGFSQLFVIRRSDAD